MTKAAGGHGLSCSDILHGCLAVSALVGFDTREPGNFTASFGATKSIFQLAALIC